MGVLEISTIPAKDTMLAVMLQPGMETLEILHILAMQNMLVNCLHKKATLEISHILAMPLPLAILLVVVVTMICLAGLVMSLLLAMQNMLVMKQVLWTQEISPPICTIVATATMDASWPTKPVFQVNANNLPLSSPQQPILPHPSPRRQRLLLLSPRQPILPHPSPRRQSLLLPSPRQPSRLL